MPFFFYEDIFFKSLALAVQDLIDDHVQRIEMKHMFGVLYNDEGPISIESECIKIQEYLQNLNEQRIAKNLNPIQLAFINAWPKICEPEIIGQQIEDTIKMRARFPDLIIGFDLVAEEETTKQLVEYAEQFVKIPQLEQQYGIDLPLFLHGGETLDSNIESLYDILTLPNIKRIGHGVLLFKSPNLIQKQIIPRNIGIEVCPISNQILGYIKDLRIHPAILLLNQGVNVTINPDDPSVFKYKGVTFDYITALLAWQLDLNGLKKLVYNSIDVTEAQNKDKQQLLELVNLKWDVWINKLISSQF